MLLNNNNLNPNILIINYLIHINYITFEKSKYNISIELNNKAVS